MEPDPPIRELIPLSEISREEVLKQLTASLRAGEDWFDSLLAAIATWTIPEETVNGRRYRYLVGNEAFDWLLLAERLTLAVPGLVPEEERDRLLFHGILPHLLSEPEFKERVGPAKYRAIVNFWYGVRVEEALVLAVEHEIRKQRHGLRPEELRLDDTVFEHLYGASRTELVQRFAAEYRRPLDRDFSLHDLDEFTYWLFKHRLRRSDKARLASDTKKGIDFLRGLGRETICSLHT